MEQNKIGQQLIIENMVSVTEKLIIVFTASIFNILRQGYQCVPNEKRAKLSDTCLAKDQSKLFSRNCIKLDFLRFQQVG